MDRRRRAWFWAAVVVAVLAELYGVWDYRRASASISELAGRKLVEVENGATQCRIRVQVHPHVPTRLIILVDDSLGGVPARSSASAIVRWAGAEPELMIGGTDGNVDARLATSLSSADLTTATTGVGGTPCTGFELRSLPALQRNGEVEITLSVAKLAPAARMRFGMALGLLEPSADGPWACRLSIAVALAGWTFLDLGFLIGVSWYLRRRAQAAPRRSGVAAVF